MTNITTMTALFDTRAEAERAQLELLNMGVREDAVAIIDQRSAGAYESGPQGFWESVRNFFIPDADGHVFAEGVRRGAFLLIARVEDRNSDEVVELLENSDAVNLDTRSREWQSQGWSPYQAEAAASGASQSAPADTNDTEVDQPNPNIEPTRTTSRVRTYAHQQPSEVPPAPVASDRSSATEPVAVKNFSGERTRGIDETANRRSASENVPEEPRISDDAANKAQTPRRRSLKPPAPK